MPDNCVDGMLIAFLVAIRIGLKKTSSNIQARVQRSGSEEPGGVSPWVSYLVTLESIHRIGSETHVVRSRCACYRGREVGELWIRMRDRRLLMLRKR